MPNLSQTGDPRFWKRWEKAGAIGTVVAYMRIIAVSFSEFNLYGCPFCGYRSVYSNINGGGAASCSCGECDKNFILLADGLTRSPIGIGRGDDFFYPKFQSHPRRGIPSHERADNRPVGDGEFFRSRGVNKDMTPGCFVCGGEDSLYSNIAAYVQCKAAGERVVEMFSTGARLDYREYEPDYIQVKVGACEQHVNNLEWLGMLTREQQGVITTAMIEEARA